MSSSTAQGFMQTFSWLAAPIRDKYEQISA
jgi:hypothetical protein